MRIFDLLTLSWKAITANQLRTFLMLLGMAIGVAAVILLTALGDSARRYVTGEFAELGTNLVVVLPGRSETTGGPPPLLGETPRDLTIDDAMALLRSHNIKRVAPIMVGSAPVSWQGLEREVSIIGTTHAMKEIRHLKMAQGSFLPEMDPHRAAPVCVIGEKLRRELFGPATVLGEWLRISDRRCRVIGVLARRGVSIGVDFDDMVLVPVASAQSLFNSQSLFRIINEANLDREMDMASRDIRRIIKDRHEGEDDITIITQDSIIATFDKIFTVLTLGLAGIAAISLAVAGILIMNIMLVAVAQRTAEIGLLKALGAPGRQIRLLFITEALLLSLLGAAFGLITGLAATEFLHRLYPLLPIAAPVWAIIASIGIAMLAGITFGVIPALHAARLDPVQALAKH